MKNLKNYIKILLESSGWSPMIDLLENLKRLSGNEKEIKNYLISNGYKRLGSGNFREVFAKPNEDWIIKVAGSHYESIEKCRESNLTEAQSVNSRYDIKENLPKLYGYDEQGSWLILERCKTFSLNLTQEQEDVLLQMFPTIKMLQEVFYYYGMPDEIVSTDNLFEVIRIMIWEIPKKDPPPEEYQYVAGNLKNFDFINEIFKVLFDNFNFYMSAYYRDEIMQIKNTIYVELGETYNTPSDIAFLYRLNQRGYLEDIYLDNLGYSSTPKNGSTYTYEDLKLIDTGFNE